MVHCVYPCFEIWALRCSPTVLFMHRCDPLDKNWEPDLPWWMLLQPSHAVSCLTMLMAVWLVVSVVSVFNNNKNIYNAHIAINHESESRAVARWPGGVC